MKQNKWAFLDTGNQQRKNCKGNVEIWIWSSQGDPHGEWCLEDCNAVCFWDSQMFRKDTSLPSPGSKTMPSKRPAETGDKSSWLIFRPWILRWHVPLKRRSLSELHGVRIRNGSHFIPKCIHICFIHYLWKSIIKECEENEQENNIYKKRGNKLYKWGHCKTKVIYSYIQMAPYLIVNTEMMGKPGRNWNTEPQC